WILLPVLSGKWVNTSRPGRLSECPDQRLGLLPGAQASTAQRSMLCPKGVAMKGKRQTGKVKPASRMVNLGPREGTLERRAIHHTAMQSDGRTGGATVAQALGAIGGSQVSFYPDFGFHALCVPQCHLCAI